MQAIYSVYVYVRMSGLVCDLWALNYIFKNYSKLIGFFSKPLTGPYGNSTV